MHEFNQSLRYDKRMHAADIRGSIAYAKALSKVNILTADELQKIVTGLQTVGKEWEDGVVCRPPGSKHINADIAWLSVPDPSGR